MPTETDNGESPSPLVRQLKQKFDRIYTANLTQEYSKSHSQSHIHRVGNDEIDGAYPLLPVCCFWFLFSRAYNRKILLKMSFLSKKKGQTSRQIDDDDHDHEVKLTDIVSLTYSQNNGNGEWNN